MLYEVRNYLDRVRYHLRLDPLTERQVISELINHFEEKIAELREKGDSEKEAARAAIVSFGRARVVARLMYEAYSKGDWNDAAMASLPHLLMAGLFAFHLWQHAIIAPVVFISMVLVTLFGWWHGKPNWLYSWIGYSLAPLLLGGYASISTVQQAIDYFRGINQNFPSIWAFALIAGFFIFFLWLVIRTTIRVVKRDWILASVMLVPLPILGSWLFNVRLDGLFQVISTMHQWDTPMALGFTVLGVMAAAFIRLRRRVLKVGAVVTVGSMALTMVANNVLGGPGLFNLLVLFILMLAYLFIPALVEKKVGHGEEESSTWWSAYPEQSSVTK